MRVIYNYQGREEIRTFERNEILIGRLSPLSAPDLDLGADPTVSRKHCRIKITNGEIWIEDSQSTNGTVVDGEYVESTLVTQQSAIRAGETSIRLEFAAAPAPGPVGVLPPRPGAAPKVAVVAKSSAAQSPGPAPAIVPAAADTPADADFKRRLASLYKVPLSFTPDMRLPEMLQAILARVISLIPGAKRGALMLHDPASGRVQVGASLPQGEVIVSESLARRVMEEGHGFILHRDNEDSLLDKKLVTFETGMYAPLLLKEKPLGAIYLDDPAHPKPFSEDDMQFLLAVAHYIAVIIFNQDLQSKNAHNASLLNRITVKFPPRVQERLLENLRLERLHQGAQKSELPVLFVDLRGFAVVAGLPPADASVMLRDYLGAVTDAVFRYDGTLIKTSGEEIFAVFGSPEPDLQQNEKAVCAALAMEQAIKEINTRRTAQKAAHCELAVGVHIGEVLHGFVGTGERMDFIALGAGITRASHYSKGARNGEVLIGPEVYQKVFKIIEADRTTVVHKELGEFHCYRVKGLKGGKPA